MRIKSGTRLWRGVWCLARIPEPSKQARQRLKWMDYYREHGGNARLTCRHFGISPQTFPSQADWKRRFSPRDLKTLEDRSCRPKRVRRHTWGPELAAVVLAQRESAIGGGQRQARGASTARRLASAIELVNK